MFKNLKLKRASYQCLHAQGIVEYILLVASVLVVLIMFLGKNGPFKNKIEGSLNSTVDQMDNLKNEIVFNDN